MYKTKIISGVLCALLLFGCNTQTDVEQIRKEIKKHKKEIRELNTIVDSLQKILDTADAGAIKHGIPVEVKIVKYEKFKSFFVASGNVEAINDAFISPEMNGQIKKIYVKKGERVQKGQLLVTLNTAIIDNTIAEIEKRLELANEIFKKQEKLWNEAIGSEVQYLQAKNNKEALEKSLATAKAQKELSVIKAPFAGIVDDIFFKEGEMAAPGIRLIQLVNLKKLKIVADISESFLPIIKKGDTVEVDFPTYPGIKYKVPVNRTGNVIKPENRTFVIEMLIDNEAEILKPNIVATLKINDYTNDSAIVVPAIIVKDDHSTNSSFVFKATKQGNNIVAKKIDVREIKTYKAESIIEGINVGDTLIVAGDVTNGAQIFIK